jgi:hypothetical protein
MCRPPILVNAAGPPRPARRRVGCHVSDLRFSSRSGRQHRRQPVMSGSERLPVGIAKPLVV